jgi:pre-mRNA-splicing factor CWC26
MNASILARYGGAAAAAASGDSFTAEELEAMKRKKKKKHPESTKPLAMLSAVRVVDLDAPQPSGTGASGAAEDTQQQGAEPGAQGLARRPRLESSDSETEAPAAPTAAAMVEVDSDGDVRVARLRRRRSSSSSSSQSGAQIMSSGTTAGLKSAEEFARELALAKAKLMPQHVSSATQQTVYRDKSGKRIEVDDSLLAREQNKAERAAQDAAIRYEMNLGAADKLRVKQQQARFEEARHLSMNELDPTWDRERREEVHEDDPMVRFLSARPEQALTATGKPKYQGPPPAPNRFGVRPGFRWDGVNRGNGWEAKVLRTRNASKA